MLGIQIKRTYERDIATKGWDVTRKRVVEVLDPIHNTLTNQLADQSGAIVGQSWFDSLIAAYEFEGNADDLTNNGHNGTTFNVLYAAGIQGQQACFNGIDSRIVVPDDDDFSFSTGSADIPFSLAGWANFTTLEGGTTPVTFKDSFDRANGALGNSEFPASAWLTQSGSPATIVSNALQGISTRLTSSHVSNLGYNNVKIEAVIEYVNTPGGGDFAYVIVNTNTGTSDGVGFGVNGGGLQLLEGGSVRAADVAFNTTSSIAYYCSYVQNGRDGTLKVATGNYFDQGGILQATLFASNFNQNKLTGSNVQFNLIGTATKRILEIEVTQFLKFEDTFTRADGALVNAENPINPWVDIGGAGAGSISNNKLVYTTEGNEAVNMGSPFPYSNARLRFKFLFTLAGSVINGSFQYNGSAIAGNDGIQMLVQANTGNQLFDFIENGSSRKTGSISLSPGTQYFCEVLVNGANYTIDFTTVNYKSLGGTNVLSDSGSNLLQSANGTHFKSNWEANAGQLEFEEISVEQIGLVSSAGNVLLSKMDRNTLNEEWLLSVDTNSKKLAFRISTDKDNYSEIQTTQVLAVATQYHVIVTNDGTGITGTTVCINGLNAPLDSPINVGTYTGMNNTSQNVVFGAWFDSGSPEFHLDGKLDQWLIAKDHVFTPSECTFLYNSGAGVPFSNDDPIPPEDDDQIYRAFITQVKENHRFIEEGILQSGDAIGSFLFSADLLLEDVIIDPETGRQYEIAAIETPPIEGALFFQKFVALKWVNR